MTNRSTWAVIPVKRFAGAKSRLSDYLDDPVRRDLASAMLEDALVTLGAIERIDRVLIISSEPQAFELADRYGVMILREPVSANLSESRDAGLNKAIKHAANYLLQQNVEQMLVLPADMPLMNPEDLQILIKQSIAADDRAQTVTLVPDQNYDGTNALLVSPPDLIHFSYGPHSYQHHIQKAKELNVNLFLPDLPSFYLDIDTPEDLHFLWLNQHKLGASCRTLDWLDQNLSKGEPNTLFDTVKLKEQWL